MGVKHKAWGPELALQSGPLDSFGKCEGGLICLGLFAAFATDEDLLSGLSYTKEIKYK